MNKKKLMVWMGSFLILGLGLAFSADSPQKAARNPFQNTVKSGFGPGPSFVDEDGDGICDHAPAFNKEGTANRQDPDWAKKKDGSNFRNKNENNAASDHFQNRFSHREENTWNRQSSRQSRANFGTGECDGLGSKGRESKKGNGNGKS
jgi:hypothetical protein